MKRKTLIVALAVCLVAIMAFGTLAFFSAQDDITNKFMITDYDPDNPYTDPDEIFSIVVEETDPETGKPTSDGITYDDIQPGDTVSKDPTVKNTGKYDQYVRVHVTVTNAKNWMGACEKYSITDLTTIFGDFDSANWTRVDDPVFDEDADTLTYTYYYNNVLEPDASATLFKTVKIPDSFTATEMVALQSFELKIAAEAIQTANTGANAVEAFTNCWGK